MERKNGLPPVHPGEIIKQDILPSAGLSVTAAAKALRVSRQMLHDILAERKPLSAIMCLKVSRLFGGSPEVWMRLQAAHDLKKAGQDKKVMARVVRIVPLSQSKKFGPKPLRADGPSSACETCLSQAPARPRRSTRRNSARRSGQPSNWAPIAFRRQSSAATHFTRNGSRSV